MLFEQPEKVAVFGHDDCPRIPGREIDFVVICITQFKVADSLGIDGEFLANPGR